MGLDVRLPIPLSVVKAKTKIMLLDGPSGAITDIILPQTHRLTALAHPNDC
jgi:hypothetical protein